MLVSNLGFPRIGVQRELKKAVEEYWAGKASAVQLASCAAELRTRHWRQQAELGVQLVPCNDFTLYDHMLDMVQVLGCVPARFDAVRRAAPGDALALYFAQARGFQLKKGDDKNEKKSSSSSSSSGEGGATDVTAMEMTKWFDTNYHFIVPELLHNQTFHANPAPILAAFSDAVHSLGNDTKRARPVLVGPLTFLLLSKLTDQNPQASATPSSTSSTAAGLLALLPALLPAYVTLLTELAKAGAKWVQLDEPILVTDLVSSEPTIADAFRSAYTMLREKVPASLQLMLATYFGGVSPSCAEWVYALPVQCVHVDVTRSSPQQLAAVATALSRRKDGVVVSLGLVDGRNIWKTNFATAMARATPLISSVGGPARVWLSPSCSLLHVPIDLSLETALPASLHDWLAFALDKLRECSLLAQLLSFGPASKDRPLPPALAEALSANSAAMAARRSSPLTHVDSVRARLQALLGPEAKFVADPETGMQALQPLAGAAGKFRRAVYGQRALAQKQKLHLPALPTTTIGSFPQTDELRSARARFKNGKLSRDEYEQRMRQEIEFVVSHQTALDLDVLVHGEPERNDMVEYFGEQLSGFAFTRNGWVQSYGSRCVKPPILYGDVQRATGAMTVKWSVFAQSLTNRPMKAMLTGPVTILQWSFVRDDQPRRDSCLQVAAALRDEVLELEAGGLPVIQIDEPAVPEGQPLRVSERGAYFEWAAMCFRLCVADVKNATQIHTHMCYCEFDALVLAALEAMDPDVVSLEASRSQHLLLSALQQRQRAAATAAGAGAAAASYALEMGPGMYDIHSPRIPTQAEMEAWLLALVKSSGIPAERLWVNPDCGLKTRTWPQVEQALANMVAAAKAVRAKLTLTATGLTVSA